MDESRRIVICGHMAQPALDYMEEAGYELYLFPDLNEEAVEAASQAISIVVRSHSRITAEVLDLMPELKAVGRPGAGVENVDVDAAAARGVEIINVPGGNAPAVAEHTLALMLALSRKLFLVAPALREGEWLKAGYEGGEIAGKTLALIGLGRVGVEVARRALSMGMKVVAYDPYVSTAEAEELGVDIVELEEALSSGDVISLHAPATPETERMLNAERLAMVKRGALLVNTSRGSLVDEDALLAALNEGGVAGAALDVFRQEPPAADSPLLRHPHVIATPHIAGASSEGRLRVSMALANRLVAYLSSD